MGEIKVAPRTALKIEGSTMAARVVASVAAPVRVVTTPIKIAPAVVKGAGAPRR